jgi:hypothetical protein
VTIAADDTSLVLFFLIALLEYNRDFLRVADDVLVGQDVSLVVEYETGTAARNTPVARGALLLRKKLATKLERRCAFATALGGAHRALGLDEYDRGTNPLGHVGEDRRTVGANRGAPIGLRKGNRGDCRER